jgi:predicted DNA-binding mobile mystery protein A
MIADRGPPGKRVTLAQTTRAFPRLKSKHVPRAGWIRAIREALGISQAQLAARAGISRATVQKLEHAEVRRRITLASLDRLAQAMGCQVAVAIIPKGGTLDEVRRNQALAKAEALLGSGEVTEKPAKRGVPPPGRERRRQRLVAKLLRGSPRKLWR